MLEAAEAGTDGFIGVTYDVDIEVMTTRKTDLHRNN